MPSESCLRPYNTRISMTRRKAIKKHMKVYDMNKILKFIKEEILFITVLMFFMGYYVYRIFAITPWYDELYTYINFIEKGFLYSATHWPAPNNHVLFSMLSSFLKVFGVYIGLRGISWLAAVGTLLLLYAVLKRLFPKGIAVSGIMVYGMLIATNTYAVQGRGYSLATFCLILALYCGLKIVYGEVRKRFYILYALALYMGLYTLMSSVYWVLSMSLCLGLLLLLLKQYRKLLWLIITSGAAAVLTVCSYSVLWSFMGAQSIQAESALNSSELSIIFEHPRSCLVRGINIMTNDPNLQSIDRNAFIRDFKYFFRGILDAFVGFGYNSMLLIFSILIAAIFIIGILQIIWCKRKKKDLYLWKALFSYIFSSVGFGTIYVLLLIQSVYPFTRVFSFAGIYLAVLICLILDILIKPIRILIQHNGKIMKYSILVNIPVFFGCIYCMIGAVHNQEYSVMDYYALDAVQHVDWSEINTYAVSDIYVGQQVTYHEQLGAGFAITMDVKEPEIIIMYKTESANGWPFIVSDEDIQHFDLENRVLEYQNELYCVYR